MSNILELDHKLLNVNKLLFFSCVIYGKPKFIFDEVVNYFDLIRSVSYLSHVLAQKSLIEMNKKTLLMLRSI